MARSECLTEAELAAFQLGDLSESALQGLAGHLERCPRCQEAVRALDGLSDGTLTAYRRSAGTSPFAKREAPPRRVGDYEILGEIGRGGMGVVYRARHVRLARVTALKMLLGGPFSDREQRLRFRAEAEVVARLRHPHIVQLFEIGEHEVEAGLPRPYFTLEFVEGGNLAQRLAGRPLAPHQAAAWLDVLARAVHHAHEQGIIHRDLKPSNVLLTGDGQPKVCDFGVAKFVSGSDLKTLSGMIIGTAEYMAPEQADAPAAPGPGCDVYALGAILYEMLTGSPPFRGATPLDTLNQVRAQEPVPVRGLQPSVPRDLETITLKCLAKRPERRYASARELADDLRRWLNREPILARPTGAAGRLVRWCQRRPALSGMAAALLLVTVLGFAGVVWQWLRAEAARGVAVREREAADWQTYRANVSAALGALQMHNPDRVREFLAAATEGHRNWEWRYLAGQLEHPHATLTGHKDQVVTLAFSPDGRILASGSVDGTVRLWETATGHELAFFPAQEAPVAPVAAVTFSPDGKRLAALEGEGAIRLWDVATGEPSPTVFHGRFAHNSLYYQSLSFSPDGSLLSVVGQGGLVYMWNTATGAPRDLPPCSTQVYREAFSPDGKLLVAGCQDGSVTVWDTATGKARPPWKAHSIGVYSLAFRPDGKCLATGGDYPDNTVRLWDLVSGREIPCLPRHKNQVTYLTFSADGSRLISASSDQTARLWDGITGKALATLMHRGRVTDAVFRPGGAQVVTRSDDRTLRLWDTQTRELIAVLGESDWVGRGTLFSPDGKLLASAADDHTIRLWDVRSLEHNGVLHGHDGFVYDAAFSPDGAQIASAAWDGTVRLWDVKGQRKTGSLPHTERIVSSVAFSPDGKQLTSMVRGRVYLWDLASGLASRKPKHVWEVAALEFEDARAVFNPQGSLVAAAAANASAQVWEVASGRSVAVLGLHQGSANDVAFSPDGKQLVTGERDHSVRIWDVASEALGGVLRGHKEEVLAVRYSHDGRFIASASLDNTVRLWDSRTHAELAVLPHGCPVYGLAFLRDGTRLATACRDNTIRLWDLATHEEVAELRGHGDYVHAVAFSPDGTRLVSCSGDFTVRIWDTLPAQVRARSKGD